MTKELSYNESVIMLFVYKSYKNNGECLSINEIAGKTKMLKSLINRTANSLEEKKLIERFADKKDKRTVRIRCIPDNLNVFLKVHIRSIEKAKLIINCIGMKDAKTFNRIVKKLESIEKDMFCEDSCKN